MQALLYPLPVVLILAATLGLAPTTSAQEISDELWTSRKVLTLPEVTPPILDFAFHENLKDVYLLVGDPNKQRIFANGVFVDPPDLSYFGPLKNGGHQFGWSTMANVDGQISDGKAYLNGQLLVEDDWVGIPQSSVDGKTIAYWRGNGAVLRNNSVFEAGHYALHLGDKVVAKQERRPGFQFALSPNGKKIAYVLEKENMQKTLHLGKKELVSAMFIQSLVWSADSSKLAFQTGSGGLDRSHVYLNGKHVDHDFDAAAAPALGPKGKKLAFLFRDGEKVGVMAGKKPWKGRWDLLSPPVWSPKAKSLAVIANLGADPILLRSNSFGSSWFAQPYHFLADRDTGGFRLAELRGTFQLVIDDEPVGKTYRNAADPVWGPKGKRIAFRAQSEESWFVVVDGVESESFDRVTAPIFHPQDGRVGFGALRGKEVHWVVFEPNDEP
ncbi:MAG: hypothetical protein ACPG31_03475 [Planctomycetota bacterium]